MSCTAFLPSPQKQVFCQHRCGRHPSQRRPPHMLWASPLNCPSHLSYVLYCSLQVKLMKYICKQLQCKQKVPETERPEALDSYPRLRDWLRTINLRPELIEVGHVVLCECQFTLAWANAFVSHKCVFSMCTRSMFSCAWGMPSKGRWSRLLLQQKSLLELLYFQNLSVVRFIKMQCLKHAPFNQYSIQSDYWYCIGTVRYACLFRKNSSWMPKKLVPSILPFITRSHVCETEEWLSNKCVRNVSDVNVCWSLTCVYESSFFF